MQFKGSFVAVVAALAAVASAASNAFTYPLGGETVYAGSTMTIKWTNVTGDTVTLRLLTGKSTDLSVVSAIGTNVTNQGSAAWVIPENIDTGLYAFSIVEDDNSDLNYSGQFTIIGQNVTSSSSSSSSSASSSASSIVSSSSAANSSSSALTGVVTSSSSNRTTSGSHTASATSGSSRSSASASSGSSSSKTGTVSSNGAVPAVAMPAALGAIAFALL